MITIFRYEDAYGNWTYNTCTTKDSDEGQPWSVINIIKFIGCCLRCATEVDAHGYVVDNAWGDCLDGCPGTRQYFDHNSNHCHHDKDDDKDEDWAWNSSVFCMTSITTMMMIMIGPKVILLMMTKLLKMML